MGRNKRHLSLSAREEKAMDNSLTYMVHVDFTPFRAVDKKGFKKVLQTTSKGTYQGKSRKTICRRRTECVQKFLSILKKKFARVDNFALTADMCTTSKPKRSFLVGTLHFFDPEKKALRQIDLPPVHADDQHTGVNIASHLTSSLERLGVGVSKISGCTTDSGSNMLATVRILGCPQVNCVDHKVHLAVVKAIEGVEEVQQAVNHVKSIAAFFNRSPAATNLLRKAQERKGVKENDQLVLINPGETRWNGALLCIMRYENLAGEVEEVVISLEKAPPLPSPEERLILSEIASILKPCKEITDVMSGSFYPTSGMAIPACKNLLYSVSQYQTQSEIGQRFKIVLFEKLKSYFADVFSNEVLLKSMVIDPRFKLLYFDHRMPASDQILSRLEAELREIQSLADGDRGIADVNENEVPPMNWMATLFSDNEGHPLNFSVQEELSNYLSSRREPMACDVVNYWFEHEEDYPNLFKLSQKYLCVQASSAASERNVSRIGNVATDKRAKMKASSISEATFLSTLSDDIWKEGGF